MATGGITATLGDFLCQRIEISKCPSLNKLNFIRAKVERNKRRIT
jgi:hypothetical protein